jgi:Terminase large subunit, T4likevirus-type, N-terminal/Terminase RNaseH-like domain
MGTKGAKKVIKVGSSEIIADEQYYLNNPNLPKADSTYTYTPEMVATIAKCRQDIVYFAEHFFFVNGIYGKEHIKLFDKQKRILRTIQGNKKTLLITSRQWGKSTLMTIVAVWTALFFPDQTIVIVANKQSTATEIFNRVRLAFIEMDNWIKGGVVEFNKTFFTLANGSRILTSATSPDAIRGLTIDVLLLDEFAIIPPQVAEDFWAAVTPTLATRFNNNKNSKLIVASTPKGIGNKFYDLVSKAEKGENDFKVEKAMWYDFPGRDETWKENEVSTLGPELFAQEYECTFLNNSASPFKPEMFDKFEEEKSDPILVLENGDYLIWEEPNKDKIYTMGVDTSEGLGQDYSVAQIFDITDPLKIVQVARYSCNTIDTTAWATKVYEIAKQWYKPILLVERNGPGSGVCDRLFNDLNYPRFINEAGAARVYKHSRINVAPGITSGMGLKNKAINNMKYFVHDDLKVRINDQKTINELKVFQYIKNGSTQKWGALRGYHDDHVMAMVWALYILHSDIINQWLEVKKTASNGKPIRIIRRWEFNPKEDAAPSIYKDMNDTSPFVGVIAMKSGVVQDPRANLMGRDKVGTLEYLLDCGEHISLEEAQRRCSLPASFNQYGVRNLPNW